MKSLDCAYLSVGHFPLSPLSLIPTPPSRPHEYILLPSKTLEPNYPRLASQTYLILLDSSLTWTKMVRKSPVRAATTVLRTTQERRVFLEIENL
jgi:hypothetical protein